MDRINIYCKIALLLSLFCLFTSKVEAQTTFPPVTVQFSDGNGSTGDKVCVELSAIAFSNMEAIQIAIGFNPNVIEFDTMYLTENFIQSGQQADLLPFELNPGELRLQLTDLEGGINGGITILDNNPIIEICFELVGDCGQSSDIFLLGPEVFETEVTQLHPIDGTISTEEVYYSAGTVSVECTDMTIVANKCDTSPGAQDGYMYFYVAGGSGNYDYTISNVNPPDNMGTASESQEIEVNNLPQGNYTITATDQSTGEMVSQNVLISENFALELQLVTTDPYCWSRPTGEIETVVTRGGLEEMDGALRFEWSSQQFTPNLEDLPNGTYSVTVTDLTGCRVSASATLFVDTLRVFAELIDSASCVGAEDAVVRVWAEGGTPFMGNQYEYDTSEGDAGPVEALTLNNVSPGVFRYFAKDGAIHPVTGTLVGCQTEELELLVPVKESSIAMMIDSTNISCFGANDGQVVITGTGATNFSFQIRDESGSLVQAGNSPTMSTAMNLGPGKYTVIVADAIAGCEIDSSFNIVEPPVLDLVEDEVSAPSCLGNDGRILTSATGGTEPYTLTWNDIPDNIDDRTGLMGGMYKVVLSDANGCKDSLEYSFPDGSTVNLDATVVQAVGCLGNENGIIEANISVGGNWQYQWESADGANTFSGQTWSNLGPGTYYVTATDADNNCEAIDTVVLAPGTPIAIEANYQMPSCPNTPNGSIAIVHISGVPPFTYQWQDNSSLQVLSGIAAGTYNVTVTDANNCMLDTFFVLEAPNPIQLTVDNIAGVDCNGGNNGSATAMATGGTAGATNFNYFWSNNPSMGQSGISSTQGGFTAGQQWVIAADALCASDTLFFEIPDTPAVTIDTMLSQINMPTCFGANDGTIWLQAKGGNPSNYSFFWPDLGFSGPLTGLVAGDYTVQITDGNGCQVTQVVSLGQPDSLGVAFSTALSQPISCDGNDGRLVAEVQGGVAAFTYTWTGVNSDNNTAENLTPGSYALQVTDANGCTASTSTTLTAPDPIMATLGNIEPINCYGELTCVSIGSVSGGVGNDYTYTINNGSFRFPVDSCAAVYANDYTITVFDSSGMCSIVLPLTITQPDEVLVDAGEDIEITLGAISDPITPMITSSLAIDSILWSPLDSVNCQTADCGTVTFSPIQEQLYTVTVKDVNGCSASDDILVMVNARRNVYFPNIFTPNGDETNDHFNVTIGPGAISVMDFYILDRWGNVVYSIPNEFVPSEASAWDGRRSGEFVNPGVYVYAARVKFIDGKIIQYGGDVTVIR